MIAIFAISHTLSIAMAQTQKPPHLSSGTQRARSGGVSDHSFKYLALQRSRAKQSMHPI